MVGHLPLEQGILGSNPSPAAAFLASKDIENVSLYFHSFQLIKKVGIYSI